MNKQNVRTRFAPSPTGFVHIGSLRTALFNMLYARKHGGSVILRVEDTDQNRKVDGALNNMLSVFARLGIEFDEGPVLGTGNSINIKGEYGPYIQSERLDIYTQYVRQLIDAKKAYYCFCSEERLDDLRKEQTALKQPPMYDGLCRMLDPEKVAANLAEFEAKGKRPVVRFAVPKDGQTVVSDQIFGEITFLNHTLDDQVLLKSDGFPTYHLAVVIDDYLMQITHVIRGDEWLPSTPKHLLLYQAFGWQPPVFAHLPLILNPDKSKLSKRQGDVAVEDFLAKGYLPEALLNFVALLGWNPKTEQEQFTLQELIKAFDFSGVNKAGAVLDMQKLDWLNGLYIRQLNTNQLATLLKPYWISGGLEPSLLSDDKYLEAIAALEQERLKKLSEITLRTQYFFTQPVYEPNLLVWKKSSATETVNILSKLADYLAEHAGKFSDVNQWDLGVKQFIQANGLDNGSVLWPMRVALTGLAASPGPFEVAHVLTLGLGDKEVSARILQAKEVLEKL